ncbi:MAG: DNA-directed RNA polymerase subunit omega [Bacteroidales bacterium]|mgnify:CR=1 FL=1|nr:DNA-directed RNA polymerase subunit omega [Bacteroidales bacterium]
MPVDFKKSNAPQNTITWDAVKMSEKTNNVYEMVNIITKRANQISVEMKDELGKKLQEFASYTDNLEEVFENREQIEISRYYERLPKPVSIATQEYTQDKIYFRRPKPKTEPKHKEENNEAPIAE